MNKKYKYLIVCVCSPNYDWRCVRTSQWVWVQTGPSLGFKMGTSHSPLTKFSVDILPIVKDREIPEIQFYGQLGYHTRGSAFRYSRFIDLNENVSKGGSQCNFNNIVPSLAWNVLSKRLPNFRHFTHWVWEENTLQKTKFEIQKVTGLSFVNITMEFPFEIRSESVSKVVAMGFEFNIGTGHCQIWVPAEPNGMRLLHWQLYNWCGAKYPKFWPELSVLLPILQIIVSWGSQVFLEEEWIVWTLHYAWFRISRRQSRLE